jgi:PPOX class probable F420-dependent enzyme
MTQTDIPADLEYLLTGDVVATVAAHRSDGSIAQYQMWVDFDGEHVLLSSAVGSRKSANWQRDPRVTLSVIDHQDPWRFLVIRGRVVDVRRDEGLATIDRLSQRYVGQHYRRRDVDREIFVVEPDFVQSRYGRG